MVKGIYCENLSCQIRGWIWTGSQKIYVWNVKLWLYWIQDVDRQYVAQDKAQGRDYQSIRWSECYRKPAGETWASQEGVDMHIMDTRWLSDMNQAPSHWIALQDYERFGMMEGLDNDTRACMTMRVYDLCACTRENIRVKPIPTSSGYQKNETFAHQITLNDEVLPFRTLQHYTV